MEVLKIFQMDEPISRNLLTTSNSRSLNSSFKYNKIDQAIEIDKLRKQLILAQSENLKLQKQLSETVKEEVEHKVKIVSLTKQLREVEEINEKLKATGPVDTKIGDLLEINNQVLEEKLNEGNFKSQNNEHEIVIMSQQNKILELEEKLNGIQKSPCPLEMAGDAIVNERDLEYHKVMVNYENLLRKLLTEKDKLVDEKNTVQNHLANLELAFNDLLQKYERAKKIVEGFKQNETVLKKQLDQWDNIMGNFDKKYSELQTYAEKKITQANTVIMNKDKGNIEEVAKLKAKILQSQVKISELEKHIKPSALPTMSLFAPLKNDLRRKH